MFLDQIRTSVPFLEGGGGGTIEDEQYCYFINTIILRSMIVCIRKKK